MYTPYIRNGNKFLNLDAIPHKYIIYNKFYKHMNNNWGKIAQILQIKKNHIFKTG